IGMAEIFTKKDRTRVEPKKQGESDFAFYDSSARPEYNTYRALVNGWLAEMPEAGHADLVARCRTGTDLQDKAALAELTTHGALKRHDCTMELHPTCGHATRKPDFRVKKPNGTSVAIVEVTTFTPATPEIAQSQRDADVYNALDKAKLPGGWRLGLDIVNH